MITHVSVPIRELKANSNPESVPRVLIIVSSIRSCKVMYIGGLLPGKLSLRVGNRRSWA